jgi:hypothetical protein
MKLVRIELASRLQAPWKSFSYGRTLPSVGAAVGEGFAA